MALYTGLDSILSAANESNIPLDSLRVVGRPTDSQIPRSHDGGGDTNGAKGMFVSFFFFFSCSTEWSSAML